MTSKGVKLTCASETDLQRTLHTLSNVPMDAISNQRQDDGCAAFISENVQTSVTRNAAALRIMLPMLWRLDTLWSMR